MGKFWKSAENKRLKKFYPDNKTADILHRFPGRSIQSLNSHAMELGIKKSEAFFKSSVSGRISDKNDIGKNTRFVKNGVNVNKGKKIEDFLPASAIENLKKNRFKKGDVPHNLLPIGFERVRNDGYIEIKVRNSKNGSSVDNFEIKQRWIYEQKFGSIPDGMVIIFKDNDKTNFEIDNLKMISRSDNLLRNFNQDAAIIKKHFGIKNQETIRLIVENAPEMIEVQRKINKVKKVLRCRI